ncbi:MAG TPA: hypothetical protein VK487_04660 [Candidatus Bathyarchaeia archaeon]|nr:hypothetical protein [Candidatus Bathyarchaeia archaeon]
MGKVNLKPFDPDKLKMYKSDEFEEAYTAELELDSVPDDVWVQIFVNEHQTSIYNMKRPVSVSGNKLGVVTSTHDNLKEEIEWVKGLVNATNQRWEQYKRQVEQREERKTTKEEEDKRKLRDKLK